MKAMLEHSQTNYVELPSHLMARRIRSRTSSRASPYARAAFAAGISPNSMSSHSRESSIASITEVLPSIAVRANVLQPILVQSNIPSNISSTIGASPAKSTKSGKRSFKGNENMPDKQAKNATIRPRVNSSARRSALGWVKRPSKSSDQKENTSAGSLTKSVSFF
jgi:serine/arginine repetitive matrix protein 2